MQLLLMEGSTLAQMLFFSSKISLLEPQGDITEHPYWCRGDFPCLPVAGFTLGCQTVLVCQTGVELPH